MANREAELRSGGLRFIEKRPQGQRVKSETTRIPTASEKSHLYTKTMNQRRRVPQSDSSKVKNKPYITLLVHAKYSGIE